MLLTHSPRHILQSFLFCCPCDTLHSKETWLSTTTSDSLCKLRNMTHYTWFPSLLEVSVTLLPKEGSFSIKGKKEGSSLRNTQEHLTMVFLPITVPSEQESIPYRGVIVIIYKLCILQCFLTIPKLRLLIFSGSKTRNSFSVSLASF